jgi:hypothetical protein
MKINEMTMRTGALNADAGQHFVDSNIDTWYKNGKIVGQIEKYDLRKFLDMYSLWDNDRYVASAQLTDYSEVNLLHVDTKYRNQQILSKLLWNFKTRQGRNKLILNQYHSDDLYDIIKNGGLSRFKKYWQNSEGRTESFNPNTVDKFYSFLGPTGWYLILENTHQFNDMPHYTEGKNWITEDYAWQIK